MSLLPEWRLLGFKIIITIFWCISFIKTFIFRIIHRLWIIYKQKKKWILKRRLEKTHFTQSITFQILWYLSKIANWVNIIINIQLLMEQLSICEFPQPALLSEYQLCSEKVLHTQILIDSCCIPRPRLYRYTNISRLVIVAE